MKKGAEEKKRQYDRGLQHYEYCRERIFLHIALDKMDWQKIKDRQTYFITQCIINLHNSLFWSKK